MNPVRNKSNLKKRTIFDLRRIFHLLINLLRISNGVKKSIAIILLLVTLSVALPRYTFAASLYLTPSNGKIAVGDEFTVTVVTDTQGAVVNTAESNITFTSNTLELVSVSQGSTFLLPAPASPNKGTASAYFGGGLPNPGYSGSSGILGTMTFRARAEGRANVNITRGNILLNDGSGTKAITTTAGASFIITAAPVGAVQVFSTTHPTQTGWSNHKDVDLNWILPDKAVSVSYIFDQNPNTVPDDTVDATTVTTASFPNTKDGKWYFHIKAKGKVNDPWGPVTNYAVQIDTVAPLPFDISLISESETQKASETLAIGFDASDATSGVYRYDIYLDNNLVKELAGEPFSFPKVPLGRHSIRVDAYDRAGNGTSSDLSINVTLPSGSRPVTFADLRKYVAWPAVGLILINLLIFAILFILFKQNKKQNQVMAVIQSDVAHTVRFESELGNLKTQIDTRFDQAAKAQTASLDVLRREIDHKIEFEIEKNVQELRAEILNRIAETTKNPVRAWQLKQQVSKNIVNEMNGTKDTKDLAVLRRLYEEFMNNKV